jgi:hypothetical protein
MSKKKNKLRPGDRVDGYCYGAFGIDGYFDERVVREVGPNWVLLEILDVFGKPSGSVTLYHGDPKELKRTAAEWEEQRLRDEEEQ